MNDHYSHKGYNFTEVEHPRTPEGHRAFKVTDPNGKEDIVFAKGVNDIGSHIDKLHMIAQKVSKSEIPRDGRSFNKLKKSDLS